MIKQRSGHALIVPNSLKSSRQLSNYVKGLPAAEQDLYVAKLELCDCDCPYLLPNSLLKYGKELLNVIPPIDQDEIIMYLVFRTGTANKEQFLAYKNVKQHQYLTNGFLSDVGGLTLANENIILKGNVTHSQTLTQTAAAWVSFTREGKVITGHCDCAAGYVK